MTGEQRQQIVRSEQASRDSFFVNQRAEKVRPPTLSASWLRQLLAALLLVAVSGFAILPLWKYEYPASYDGYFHLYRAWELGRILQFGPSYPRLAPDFFFGYGFPLFNFYAPALYYETYLLHTLGFGYSVALKMVVTCSCFLASLAMFCYCSDRFQATRVKYWAALFGAVGYSYVPYYLVDLYIRGDFAEYISLWYFPALLWSFHRLQTFRQWRYWVGSVLLYAGLLFTHNASALLFTPVLVLYLVVVGLGQNWRQIGKSSKDLFGLGRVFGPTALALGSGLALSAIFWAPALLEKNSTRLAEVLTMREFDYLLHFPSLPQLFTAAFIHPYSTFRHGHYEGEYPYRIGAWQLLLCFPSCWLFFHRLRPKLRTIVGFFLFILIATLLFTLPVSLPIWSHLPLMRTLQFPWRLLELTGIATAVLAGTIPIVLSDLLALRIPLWFNGFSMKPLSALLALLCLGLTIAFSTARLQVYSSGLHEADLTLAGFWSYELTSQQIGASGSGEFLPRTVQYIPVNSPLTQAYFAGQQAPLVAPVPGLTAVTLQSSPTLRRARLVVPAGLPRPLVFNLLWLKEWTTTLDGRAVPTSPQEPTGLLMFIVPSGSHLLQLELHLDPLARLATTISELTLASLALLLFYLFFQQRRATPKPKAGESAARPLALPWLPSPGTSGIVLLLVVGALLQSYLIQRPAPLVGDSVRWPLPAGVTTAPARLGTSLALLGYRVEGQAVAGQPITVTFYWMAREPSFFNYTIFVHLEDAQGHLIAQHDSQPSSGNQPTTSWPPGAVITDAHSLSIPSQVTPGPYRVAIGAYLLETLQRLPVASFRAHSPALEIDAGNREVRFSQPLFIRR